MVSPPEKLISPKSLYMAIEGFVFPLPPVAATVPPVISILFSYEKIPVPPYRATLLPPMALTVPPLIRKALKAYIPSPPLTSSASPPVAVTVPPSIVILPPFAWSLAKNAALMAALEL